MFAIATDILGPGGVVYGLLLVVMLVQLFTFLFIPSLLHKGKPVEIGSAIYCYAAQLMGVFLMSISGLSGLQSVLTGQMRSGKEYLALLIIFAVGGFIFLWHETRVSKIDAASRAIPGQVYWFVVRLIGLIIAVSSGLSIILSMVLTATMMVPGWWVSPVTMMLYGLLLLWCTRPEKKRKR